MSARGERPIPRAELSAWMLGGVEQERAAEIASRVRASPALQNRVRELERMRPSWDRRGASIWTLPPEGFVRSGWPKGVPEAAPSLSGRFRPGQRFTVWLSDLPSAEHHQLVVMAQEGGRWRVHYPQGPGDRTSLSDLESDEAGRRQVNLTALPATGRQRWALVFPPLDFPFAWDGTRPWAPMEEALREGRLRVVRFSIEVDG